jgi:PiT family inorganic phosphate transporter
VSAFSAQLAAAAATHVFSILGIPVSTSQAVVGAVVGVGLIHGLRTVRKRRVVRIMAGWVATPTAAGLFAYGAYRLLSIVTG